MGMSKNKEIKELTKSQIAIVDEIDRLLLKLYKAGVRPILVDGGGGNGLRFVRCSGQAVYAVENAFLYNDLIRIGDEQFKTDDFVYNPANSYKYKITTINP